MAKTTSLLCCLITPPQNGGGGGGGEWGAYFIFRPIGGAFIRRGRLYEGGGGLLIRRFTVLQDKTPPYAIVIMV